MDSSGIHPSSRPYWLLALWLAGVFASSLGARSLSVDPLLVLPLALSWPLLAFVLTPRTGAVTAPRLPFREAIVLLVVVFSALSVAASRQAWHSVAYWGFEVVAFGLAYVFARRLDADGYVKGFTVYVLWMLPLLVGLVIYDYEPGRRLGQSTGILNPNSIAMVALSVAVMAALVTNRLLRWSALSVAFGVIYLTGSRASLVAALAAWSVIAARGIVRRGSVGLLIVLLAIGVGGTVALLHGSEIASAVSDLLALADPRRGLGSGLTGRLEAWRETWDLAMSHPITGVGLRAHESLIRSSSSAHNGYLSTLAEIGIIGFSATMALIAAGVLSLLTRPSDHRWAHVQTVLLGMVTGYLVLAMFERYLINLGNPTSLIFLLSLFFTRTDGIADRDARTPAGQAVPAH